MVRRVVQCETCKKQIDIPDFDHLRPYGWVLPEDWFTLVEGNPQTKTGWHFCSLSHLYQWASNKLDEEGNKA